MSSHILSYINIVEINRELLAQATDVKYFVSNLIFVYNKYLVLIQTCYRIIVDFKSSHLE